MEAEIILWPDPILSSVSQEIPEVTEETRELAQLLEETLDPEKMAGLAAVQLGYTKRMIIIAQDTLTKLVMINPEITKTVGTRTVREGCESLPGQFYAVERPKKVKCRYLGLDNEFHTITAHHFLAQVICHEIDHLGGMMLVQRGIRIMER